MVLSKKMFFSCGLLVVVVIVFLLNVVVLVVKSRKNRPKFMHTMHLLCVCVCVSVSVYIMKSWTLSRWVVCVYGK